MQVYGLSSGGPPVKCKICENSRTILESHALAGCGNQAGSDKNKDAGEKISLW